MRGIPFNAWSLTRLRRGVKTQTRRLMVFPEQPATYRLGQTYYVSEALRRGEDGMVVYASDGGHVLRDGAPVRWTWKVRQLASIYCPAWAAREWLAIVGCRQEDAPSISEEDALAEGILPEDRRDGESAAAAYLRVWRGLHPDYPIEDGALRWAYTFRRSSERPAT